MKALVTCRGVEPIQVERRVGKMASFAGSTVVKWKERKGFRASHLKPKGNIFFE